MARIAGLISDVGDSERRRRLERVVKRLPGDVVTFEEAGTATFAVKRGGIVCDGQMLFCLDGSFYNRGELCSRLSVAPCPDVSLLAQGVRHWGLNTFLERANGDFALAVWDGSARRLQLARDRFGVRPLYYVCTSAGTAFASMPWPLLAIDRVSSQLDRRYLAAVAAGHYRTIDECEGTSPYRDIMQVPMANVVEIAGGQVRTARYWNLREIPDETAPVAELAEQCRDLLRDSVRLRLEGAGKTAFTLSGGMDSSSVLACSVDLTGQAQIAYSTTYDDPTFDESADLKPMFARQVGDWREVAIGNEVDLIGTVSAMVEAHNEPVATATWLCHFELCRRAQTDGVATLFGGLGGDELNAGEYDYFFYRFADMKRDESPETLGREIDAWVRHHDHPIYRKSRKIADAAIAKLADTQAPGWNRLDRLAQTRYADALHPSLRHLLSERMPPLDNRFSSHLKNKAYRDMTTETLPCCLRAEDRHAAAFGLTIIDPFLDYRLVEFMFRVPGQLKIRDGITKVLLREAMQGLLPEETRTRVKKTGWNAPAHRWFSGRTLEWLRDRVRSRDFAEAEVYDSAAVMALIDDHVGIVQAGVSAENHMMFLWQLANTDIWLSRSSRLAFGVF